MSRNGRLRRLRVTKGRVAAVSLSTAALVAGGVAMAQASIPWTDGVITICYDKNGAMRVIDAAKTSCGKSETTLSWNQVVIVRTGAPVNQFKS